MSSSHGETFESLKAAVAKWRQELKEDANEDESDADFELATRMRNMSDIFAEEVVAVGGAEKPIPLPRNMEI